MDVYYSIHKCNLHIKKYTMTSDAFSLTLVQEYLAYLPYPFP